MTESVFFKISEDIVLNIFSKLEEDPRNWARLACVCTKFSSLIRNICVKQKCSTTIPAVCADLVTASSPPGGWAALHKLAVCCPGLLHSGVLLEYSDFGFERELGPDEKYIRPENCQNLNPKSPSEPCSSKIEANSCKIEANSGKIEGNSGKIEANSGEIEGNSGEIEGNPEAEAPESDSSWTLYDDLYFDTVYNASEEGGEEIIEKGTIKSATESESEPSVCKKRKICRTLRSHLASGIWNLSREQGNKLLSSRFRGDCLYICDWPGCIHIEEKRNYMLFRGVFKDFKSSGVWRTINDGSRSKIDMNCAFCSCKEAWDLQSAFCLRRVFGYHDDGEPIVRAYVCENGHVSGAWTDWPLYT